MKRARRSLPIAALFIVSLPALADSYERIIPEAVLNEWGYETVDFRFAHSVKSIHPIPGSTPRFYPRFHLEKTCFAAQRDAISHKNSVEAEIESNEAVRFKDAREVIVVGQCAYEVAAQGTYTFLEHQPLFMRRMKEFFCSKSECSPSPRTAEASIAD